MTTQREIDKMDKFEPCRSWACDKCKHYIKYLSINTMWLICWDNQRTFEEK